MRTTVTSPHRTSTPHERLSCGKHQSSLVQRAESPHSSIPHQTHLLNQIEDHTTARRHLVHNPARVSTVPLMIPQFGHQVPISLMKSEPPDRLSWKGPRLTTNSRQYARRVASGLQHSYLSCFQQSGITRIHWFAGPHPQAAKPKRLSIAGEPTLTLRANATFIINEIHHTPI